MADSVRPPNDGRTPRPLTVPLNRSRPPGRRPTRTGLTTCWKPNRISCRGDRGRLLADMAAGSSRHPPTPHCDLARATPANPWRLFLSWSASPGGEGDEGAAGVRGEIAI